MFSTYNIYTLLSSSPGFLEPHGLVVSPPLAAVLPLGASVKLVDIAVEPVEAGAPLEVVWGHSVVVVELHGTDVRPLGVAVEILGPCVLPLGLALELLGPGVWPSEAVKVLVEVPVVDPPEHPGMLLQFGIPVAGSLIF